MIKLVDAGIKTNITIFQMFEKISMLKRHKEDISKGALQNSGDGKYTG